MHLRTPNQCYFQALRRNKVIVNCRIKCLCNIFIQGRTKLSETTSKNKDKVSLRYSINHRRSSKKAEAKRSTISSNGSIGAPKKATPPSNNVEEKLNSLITISLAASPRYLNSKRRPLCSASPHNTTALAVIVPGSLKWLCLGTGLRIYSLRSVKRCPIW